MHHSGLLIRRPQVRILPGTPQKTADLQEKYVGAEKPPRASQNRLPQPYCNPLRQGALHGGGSLVPYAGSTWE